MVTLHHASAPHPEEISGSWPNRSTVRGTRHATVCGHYLAAQAAFTILEAGGNAIDAGVAAGLVEGVVQPDQVNIAGVAPIMIYLEQSRQVVTLAGVGIWPKAASCELFQRQYGGSIPEGILRTVVPAAPAAWLLALERYGTMSFGDVAGTALRLAAEGFPMHAFTAAEIRKRVDHYRRWEANAAVFLPGGRPPQPGERFVQTDLARTLQYLIDCEKAAMSRGRTAALRAAHDAFYRGDIADAIVRYHRENGGLLAPDDLAAFRVEMEPPARVSFADMDVLTCGFWSQGPVLLQALNIVAHFDLPAMGHNSAAYIHTLTEALKLAFADRHRYYGDPRYVDVPADDLLSLAYAAARRTLIRPSEAWSEMPSFGDPRNGRAIVEEEPIAAVTEHDVEPAADTSYVCALDKWGNLFSASPSDPSYNTVMIPGTGLCPSSRGCQSWADSTHPASIAPGKRPRLTPMPMMALKDGQPCFAIGTPGGDIQPQAILQAFLNMVVFDFDPQVAVEAPRFATRSMPDSFEPHTYLPGWLNVEARISKRTGNSLKRWGHKVHWWPARTSRAGGVCALMIDQEKRAFHAGADFRRGAYALGW